MLQRVRYLFLESVRACKGTERLFRGWVRSGWEEREKMVDGGRNRRLMSCLAIYPCTPKERPMRRFGTSRRLYRRRRTRTAMVG